MVRIQHKRVGPHLPADTKEKIICEEENRRASTIPSTILRIIGLGEEAGDEHIADTLARGAPHHKLPSTRALDEDNTSKRKQEV